MAVKIQVKRGAKAGLPTLAPGEWGLATDTREVFIGSGSGNIPVATLDNNGKIPGGNLDLSGYVPASRKINGKALTSDISLTANELGAAPQYQYGTTDIGEGAALTTGTLYFVYE